jgi:hypothetical protein
MSVGVKFHSSKLSPEQVRLFRRIELEKVNKQLDGYVHQCSKMKVLYTVSMCHILAHLSFSTWFWLGFDSFKVSIRFQMEKGG